jgi:hypothetical protein
MKHYLALFVFASSAAYAVPLKPVKLYFVEALAPRDSTSSERFQKDYDSAISAGKRLTTKRLASCGYQLETFTSFYDASDPVQAKEKAERAAKDGAWLLVGPRRSNHYLLLAQGAENTPSVSIMATASEVEGLAPLHLSLSASNRRMAAAAAREAKRRLGRKKATYLSVVSAECLACRDFALLFDAEAAKLGLQKSAEISVVGETPDTTALTTQIRSSSPSFVLLPNYSKLTSFLIQAITSATTEPFFVGGDGWGDSNFGFVQNNSQVARARGFSVRGLPPLEIGLKRFATGKALLREPKDSTAPYSGPALAILKSIDATAEILCANKPTSAASFQTAFARRGPGLFDSPWGVSIYDLEGEKLRFGRIQGMK